jgi:hypothetical protein
MLVNRCRFSQSGQMFLYGSFIKFIRLAFFDVDGVTRALTETRP